MRAEQVTAGMWRAGTKYVNWYIVDGGTDGVTVVDAGLPAYDRQLDEALASTGHRRSDVRAVVLTHGHIDHIGMALVLASAGAHVYLHDADARLADSPRSNRTQRSLLPYLRYPATAAFIAHALRHGALRSRPMPAVQPMADGEELPIPGRPMVTHAPGHTDGSCVLEFREHGAVFVGDLLCTMSPITGRTAEPQLQTRGSNRNSDEAMGSLGRLQGIDSRLVLTGHGGPWTDGIPAAVTSARRIGCR